MHTVRRPYKYRRGKLVWSVLTYVGRMKPLMVVVILGGKKKKKSGVEDWCTSVQVCIYIGLFLHNRWPAGDPNPWHQWKLVYFLHQSKYIIMKQGLLWMIRRYADTNDDAYVSRQKSEIQKSFLFFISSSLFSGWAAITTMVGRHEILVGDKDFLYLHRTCTMKWHTLLVPGYNLHQICYLNKMSMARTYNCSIFPTTALKNDKQQRQKYKSLPLMCNSKFFGSLVGIISRWLWRRWRWWKRRRRVDRCQVVDTDCGRQNKKNL